MVHHIHPDLDQLLTSRQRGVLELLRLGLTNAEIAERTKLSTAGVRYHITEIINKLGVRNRYEAAAWPERPPWWATALAPMALFWRKVGAALPVQPSSIATVLSGGLFAAALGGLGLVAFVFDAGNGDADATNVAGTTPTVGVPADNSDWLSPLPEQEPTHRATETPPAAVPTPPREPQTTSNSVDEYVATPPPPAATATPLSGVPTATPLSGVPAPTPMPEGSGVMAVDCDAGAPGVQRACAYLTGTTFTMQVHVTQAPEDGYYGVQAKVGWDEDVLVYEPQNQRNEGIWQECDIAVRSYLPDLFSNPGWGPAVLFACVPVPHLAEGSPETGAVLQFRFTCKGGGITPLTLVSHQDDPQGGTFFLDDGNGAIEPALIDSSVRCLPCTTVGCPTPEAAPTPQPTAPPPATPGPGGPGGIAVDCDDGAPGTQRICSYDGGTTFTVQVVVTEAPAGGYDGLQVKVRWSEQILSYLPTDEAADEALWPECDIAARRDNRPADSSVLFACVRFPAPNDAATFTGAVLQFEFRCEQAGTASIELVPADSDDQRGSHFIDEGNGMVGGTALTGAAITCG